MDMDSSDGSILIDVVAAVLSYAICVSVMLSVKQTYEKGLIEVNLVRKLSHVSVGLIVMLFWPMFSCGLRGRVIAGIIPGLCLVRGLAVGLGLRQDKTLSQFFTRYRHPRDILKAVAAYDLAIAFTTVFYWRTPLAIAVICNLCAGDGFADIVGRRFGSLKLPYNQNKSFAGSVSMVIAGFLASIIFLCYFSWLGYIQESPNMVLAFLILSIVSAVVESHPLSTTLDDNLTVPIASILLGIFILR